MLFGMSSREQGAGKTEWYTNLSNFLKEYELTWKDVNRLIATRTESCFQLIHKTISEEPKPNSEIWTDPPEGINPENYYFETIPNKWVDLFITESESINGKEIRNLKITD